MADQFVVRRTMQYGHAGSEVWLDRGQIFELLGLKNDAALVRLGYVSAATKGIAIVGCGVCGAKFVTDEALASHGRDRHANLSLTPDEEDRRAEQRIAKEDAVAPLDLTKTKASREAGEGAIEIETPRKTTKKAASRGARTHIGG